MGRKKVYENEQARRNAQTIRRKLARDTRVPQFTGIDGEADTSNGHVYCLLSVGDAHLVDAGGLEFTQICEFLYSCFLDDPDSVYGGYYLGYDFTQWLKTLPADRAWMLLSDKGKQLRARTRSGGNRKPFPVYYDGWEFDILAFKRFKLRPATAGGHNKNGWMYINDCGSFFQTSFLAATNPDSWSEPILSVDEYRILSAGKERRSNAVLDKAMLRYNALENDVFARLMSSLAQGFAECGIHLRRDQWYGPGQAAQKWLNGIHDFPDGQDVRGCTPAHILDLARESYYGGWFEIFAHGHIPAATYEYDINSAYPYIIARLPCLLHGQWVRSDHLDHKRLQLVRACVQGSDRHCGAMLHRMPDGCIRRPSYTEGVYWAHEILAARKSGVIDTVDIKEAWTYEPCDCAPPLRGVSGLYDQRLRIGKNTPAGKALRLLINSLYGKMAQSVGEPRYANPIYASLITSGCRTMILDAIATHPLKTDAVVMIATDGIYFTSKHPLLRVSSKLGDWDVTEKQNLTLFKPGVYWDDDTRRRIDAGRDPSFKARGVNAKAFGSRINIIDDWFASWREYPAERDPMGAREGFYPRITFDTSFAMVTATQACIRGKWDQCGSVGHTKPHSSGCQSCSGAHLVQDADPIGKRHSGWHDPRRNIFWSEPYPDGGPNKVSTPYSRRFGQPDPDEYGITPDGTVVDHVAQIFVT